MDTERIIVIGAGPAGMMAAIRSAQLKQDVYLLEKNSSSGRKLLLSGKGRCNLTNLCELEAFIKRFLHGGDFLRNAFAKFFHRDLIKFFENRGLKLKTERQLRVFPVTDKANSILEVLVKELHQEKVKIFYQAAVKEIILQDKKVQAVLLEDGRSFLAKRIILATGGASYGFTGSTGDGFNIARKLGHSVTSLEPGLVPFKTRQRYPLAGLALKNIRLKISNTRKSIVSEIGELLFTHSGISGPLVISLSAKINDLLKQKDNVYAEIDLKPALTEKQLDQRLLREFKAFSRKTVKNVLKELLPLKLVDLFMELAKIAPQKQVSQVTQKERQQIIRLLRALHLDIVSSLPIDEAMVTRGGISLKEINPRTMESRLIQGLYFAGEIIDVDADTGGFNLQAAFSTGYLAGESAAMSLDRKCDKSI